MDRPAPRASMWTQQQLAHHVADKFVGTVSGGEDGVARREVVAAQAGTVFSARASAVIKSSLGSRRRCSTKLVI